MEIRKFEKADLSQNMDSFCELYHKAFTAAANREIIEQRYLENPFEELLMYVAIDNGRIVANYSAVPIRVVVNGEVRKAALSLNTMTDPEYAGRGLFTTLATALYDYLSSNGYAMIIGFPNFMSNRTFNTRLGWRTVLEIPTLKLDLETCRLSEENEQVIASSFDSISRGVESKQIHVDLSTEYINWRFRDNKEKQYNVHSLDNENWLIYQFYNDEINITEINCVDTCNEQELIQRLISVGKKKGYKYITTWRMTNTESHSYLEKVGFRMSSPIRTFGLRCFDGSISDYVYDPRNWLVQMGDDNTY